MHAIFVYDLWNERRASIQTFSQSCSDRDYTLPVIGVPIKGSVLDGVDALYSIIQMPPGIPVATVAINGAMNAAILAVQMLALSDKELAEAFTAYKEGLKKKIVKANEDLKEVKYEYKTN